GVNGIEEDIILSVLPRQTPIVKGKATRRYQSYFITGLAGQSPEIEIHLAQDRARFCNFSGMSLQCTCRGANSLPPPSRGLSMRKMDADMLPPTPTSPDRSSNAQWLSSVQMRDNIAVMHRLSNMWMHPVDFGIVRMTDVLGRIFQVSGVRKRDYQAASYSKTDGRLDWRSACDARSCPILSDRSGLQKQEDEWVRLCDDEKDDETGLREVKEDEEVVVNTLQRCKEPGMRESARTTRRREMAEDTNNAEDADQCMFDVDIDGEDGGLSSTCG
ncbi:hypothetical protein KEM54_002606, partial [Ascosphaera aggregata]